MSLLPRRQGANDARPNQPRAVAVPPARQRQSQASPAKAGPPTTTESAWLVESRGPRPRGQQPRQEPPTAPPGWEVPRGDRRGLLLGQPRPDCSWGGGWVPGAGGLACGQSGGTCGEGAGAFRRAHAGVRRQELRARGKEGFTAPGGLWGRRRKRRASLTFGPMLAAWRKA